MMIIMKKPEMMFAHRPVETQEEETKRFHSIKLQKSKRKQLKQISPEKLKENKNLARKKMKKLATTNKSFQSKPEKT